MKQASKASVQHSFKLY